MPWLTGDDIPSEVFCRVIRVPNDPTFIQAVSGALLDLTYQRNWEQHGTLTPKQQADAFDDVYLNFVNSEGCDDITPTYPEHFLALPHQFQKVNGGTFLPIVQAAAIYNVWSQFTVSALNDEIKTTIPLKAGVYSAYIIVQTNPAGGRMTCNLDSVYAFTLETYNNVPLNNQQLNVTNSMEVLTDGIHTFNMKIASKFASSTGYNFRMSGFYGYRVGDLP